MYSRLPDTKQPPHIEPASFVTEKLPLRETQSSHESPNDMAKRVHESRRYHYDDPPPPSVIRSYRESRSKKSSNTPQSLVGQSDESSASNAFQPQPHQPPSSLQASTPRPVSTSQPPTTSSNYTDSFLGRAFVTHSDASLSAEALSSTSQTHVNHVQLAGRPMIAGDLILPNMPHRAPPPNSPSFSVARSLSPVVSPSSRPDSFLARAFPTDRSDVSQSSEALSFAGPSSQSHDSKVRLSGHPQVVESGKVSSASPQVVQVPERPSHGIINSTRSRRRSAAEWSPGVQQPDLLHTRLSEKQRSLPTARPSFSPQQTTARSPSTLPPAKSRLRRDQIVIPAPLAPNTSSSGPSYGYASSPSPLEPDLLPQLRRSKQRNSRRRTLALQHQSQDWTSRRVSFPPAHATIAENEGAIPLTGTSQHHDQRRNVNYPSRP